MLRTAVACAVSSAPPYSPVAHSAAPLSSSFVVPVLTGNGPCSMQRGGGSAGPCVPAAGGAAPPRLDGAGLDGLRGRGA